MKRRSFVLSLICLSIISSGRVSGSKAVEAPDTLPSVELERYTGLWYQVPRYPHFFQTKECRLSTAKYTLLDDGRIEVKNDCWADEARGKRRQTVRVFARPIDATNAWLKVRFYGLFDADYLIIELDEDYRWVAVTPPEMNTLWVLSREPSLREDIIRTSLQ